MELLIRSSGKARFLPTVDPVGKLLVRIGLVGHQAQWGGGEHLPLSQVDEAGMPSLTIPLHSGDERTRPYARRPSFRGGRFGPPRRRENYGPDLRGRHRSLPPRHTRQHGKGPKGLRHLLQGIRSKNQLEQIMRDMGQQKGQGLGVGPRGRAPMDPERQRGKIPGNPGRIPLPPRSQLRQNALRAQREAN